MQIKQVWTIPSQKSAQHVELFLDTQKNGGNFLEFGGVNTTFCWV